MNRTVPIVLLITLISILGGFLLMLRPSGEDKSFWTFQPKEEEKASYDELKKEEINTAQQDADAYNLAIQEKRLDLCDPIQSTEKKQECRNMIIASQALQEKDIELCTTLTHTGIRDRCRDNIAYFLAEEKSEIDTCDMIVDETIRSNCIESIQRALIEDKIASKAGDLSFCDTIEDSTLQNDCKRKISTENDSESYRKAIAATALSECENILDAVLKIKCRDAVLFDLAVTEGNLDFCTNITDSERSEYCRRSLLSRKDVSRYQQLVRTGNLEACNELTVIQMKNQCRDTIIFAKVRETQDETFCDLLYNTGMTSQCREMITKDSQK